MSEKFDFFVFGSTSEILQDLVTRHKAWFLEHVRHLYVIQRTASYPDIYKDFPHTAIQLDCGDAREFRRGLTEIVAAHASHDRDMHVFSTYGRFNWSYAEKSPVFLFSDEGYQINLNSRLQILDAFKDYAARTRFHMMGSLFANFPYTGDYALSMWYVNQIPRNAEYSKMHINVYNIGGCRTRFWNHAAGPKNNPFLHDEIPSAAIFERGFRGDGRGVMTFYPSTISRVACFLGARGVRVL